jgi:putative halomucin
MNGLLLLKPEAKERLSSGAGGKAFGEAEIIPDTPSKNSNITEEKPKNELSNDTYEKPKDELPNDGRQDNNSGKNSYPEVAAQTEVSDKPASDDSRVVIPKNSNSKVKNRRSSSSSSSSKGSKKVFHNTFTGWKPETVNGHNIWKYVENGKSVTSRWAYIFNPYTNRNAWFKFDKDGVMETGWVHENGTDYYLSEISDGSLGEWIKK